MKCKETGTQCKIAINKTDKLSFTYNSNFYHWPEKLPKNKQSSNNKLRRIRTSPASLLKSNSKKVQRIKSENNESDEEEINNDDFIPLWTDDFHQQKTITFYAQIEVLKHYDLNRKEIQHENDWRSCYEYKPTNTELPEDTPQPQKMMELSETDKASDKYPIYIIWNICDPEIILHFYDMETNGYFDSTIAGKNGLQWFLRFFPNGHYKYKFQNIFDIKNRNKSCLIFLCLKELPKNVNEIMINYRLYCHETKTSNTGIGIFDKDNFAVGIEEHDMYIIHLLLKGIISIGCFINIIKINYINVMDQLFMDKMLIDEMLLNITQPLLTEINPYKYEWNIDETMLSEFLQCNVGKKFESNIYDNLWCLKCFPNGDKMDNEGKTQLFIQLCMFPKDVTKIRLRIKLSCPTLNKVWSTITDFEIYKRTNKAWSSGILFKYELNGLKALTFIAEITVIEQYTEQYIIKSDMTGISLDGDYKCDYFQNKEENNSLYHVIHNIFKENVIKSQFDEKQQDDILNSKKYNLKICNVIKKYYNPMSIWEWDIVDQKLINKFVLARNLEKFDGDIFEYGGFKWYLKIYPNGYNNRNMGYFQVFLSMATMPPSINIVLANVRLSCLQTMTSYTFFARYTSKHRTWGWKHNLPQQELHSLFLMDKCQRLTFQSQITILKVINYDNRPIYEYQLPLFKPIDDILQIKYEHEWYINKKMMNMFRRSPTGKMFESQVFDDMFCIQIYPNGVNERGVGHSQLFCQICAFPKGITAILTKLELSCIGHGQWQHIVKFTQTQNNWGWDHGTLTIDDLYDFHQLTFKVKIQFIELYDEKGVETKNRWKISNDESDDDDDDVHDEKTPHEHDKSHQLMELSNLKVVEGYIRSNDNEIFSPRCNELNKVIVTTKQGQLKTLEHTSSDTHQYISDLITKFSMDETEMDEINELSLVSDWNMSKSQKSFKFVIHPLYPRFISDIFRFHELKWILESYVARDDDQITNCYYYNYNYYYYHVMLTLCSMPTVLSQVAISYRIFCKNTLSSTTGICILYHNNDDDEKDEYHQIKYKRKMRDDTMTDKVLSTGYLLMKTQNNKITCNQVLLDGYIRCFVNNNLLKDLYEIIINYFDTSTYMKCQNCAIHFYDKNNNNDKYQEEEMEFCCNINIIRIKDNNNDILYEYPFDEENLMEKSKFEWIIDCKMLKRFCNAYNGQKFESSDIYDNLWCVGIAPNGILEPEQLSTRSKAILYLQLCGMPVGIGSITVGCQMRCIQLQIETKYVEQSMGLNDDKFSKIQYKMIKTQKLIKKIIECDINELKIEIEICIIKMCSESNGQEVRSPNPPSRESIEIEKRLSRTSQEETFV